MPSFCPRALLLLIFLASSSAFAQENLSESQQAFRRELTARVESAQKANASAVAGSDGWLFLTNELRFLAQGPFWGPAASKASRARKPEWADPIPAITDFHRQLKERAIDLMLVPVPPKAALFADKLLPSAKSVAGENAPYLDQFYGELRRHGIEVLDLHSLFAGSRESAHGPVFCRTDSHWSGAGAVTAAEAIAEAVRRKLPNAANPKSYSADWREITFTGDLASLVATGGAKPEPEKIPVRVVSEQSSGAAVQPDPQSPVLLMGDSHTLVFREFLAERAGLLDQLAHELGFAPDLIGTRGSGATAVRVSLYRKSQGDRDYLAKKKVIVWCFAAREFTEADQGWVQQPIAK